MFLVSSHIMFNLVKYDNSTAGHVGTVSESFVKVEVLFHPFSSE